MRGLVGGMFLEMIFVQGALVGGVNFTILVHGD